MKTYIGGVKLGRIKEEEKGGERRGRGGVRWTEKKLQWPARYAQFLIKGTVDF